MLESNYIETRRRVGTLHNEMESVQEAVVKLRENLTTFFESSRIVNYEGLTNNLVLYDVPDLTIPNESTTSAIRNILETVLPNNIKPKETVRFGKFSQMETRPRPIKVIFGSTVETTETLKGLLSLKKKTVPP